MPGSVLKFQRRARAGDVLRRARVVGQLGELYKIEGEVTVAGRNRQRAVTGADRVVNPMRARVPRSSDL